MAYPGVGGTTCQIPHDSINFGCCAETLPLCLAPSNMATLYREIEAAFHLGLANSCNVLGTAEPATII